MRKFIMAATIGLVAMSGSVAAQTPTPPAPSAATPAADTYTTENTDIGTLIDNPATKAIVDKYIPGLSTGEQIDMARGMTLNAIQQYSPDMITDAKLAAINADLAKLPAKPAR